MTQARCTWRDAVAWNRSCGDWLPATLTCTLSLATDFRNSRLFPACERKPSNSARTLLGLYVCSQMSLVLAVASVLQPPHRATLSDAALLLIQYTCYQPRPTLT